MYVLDTNIFVEAHRTYYSFDIVPKFWNELQQKAQSGLLISIDRVFEEINNHDDADALSLWANNHFSPYFASTDNEDVFNSYREVIGWAISETQFTEAAKAEFANIADSWLVAYAHANNCIVVTHEQYKRDIKNRIPIPNACQALNIPYINTFEMLRRLNIRLG